MDLYVVGVEPHISLACLQLEVQQAAFLRVSARTHGFGLV